VDHIRKVAGIDHIGIGSDFDGFNGPPAGLEDVSKYPALLAELLRRGYTKNEVKKVAGRNLLRAMRGAERIAAEIQRAAAGNSMSHRATLPLIFSCLAMTVSGWRSRRRPK